MKGPRDAAALSIAWDVSSEERVGAYDAYRASMADLYEVSDVANDGKSDFQNRTTAFKLGSSALGRGRSVAQTLSRNTQQIRGSDLEHLSIIINLADTVGDADGRTVRASSGAVQFRDLTRPSSSRVDGIDLINLMTPLSIAEPWLRGRAVHGLVLPAEGPGARLIRSHLSTLVAVAGDLSEEEGIAAVEATFVIADRYMGEHGAIRPTHNDAIYRTVRRRATAILAERPLNVRPDIAALARTVGVSRSSLYRAFQSSGGVMAHIARKRLDRAYAILWTRGASRDAVAWTAATSRSRVQRSWL